MKKNPRNYKRGGAMFAYILDSVYSDVIDTFFEEKCKYDRSGMCTFDLLREWLQGLPSAISVAFYYSDIAATGKSMVYCKDARSEARFVNSWWDRLSFNILRLARIYDINMSRFY